MDLLKKLSEMNNTNNELKVGEFTVFYSTQNLGALPNFNEGRYFDILGIDGIGIEGEVHDKRGSD
jgi:hypothetical protein